MNKTSHAESGQGLPEEVLLKRFRLHDAPTLRSSVVAQTPVITFSRLTNHQSQPGRSLTPEPEEAFVFQIPLAFCPEPDIRYSNRRSVGAKGGRPGTCCLLDLRDGPTRSLDQPFDNMRLYISQTTIDAFAYEKGRRQIGGLLQHDFGAYDPVLFHLSKALLPALGQPEAASSLFVDCLAQAFCEHIVTHYGTGQVPYRERCGKLASWQMRRLEDFVAANPASNPSIIDLANQCSLSASYFAEIFKQTTGISPHQWLLARRIERAKLALRDTEASLASIATDCGFFDQSHFSRVFSRLEGCGPKDWRMRNRCNVDFSSVPR